MYAILHIPTGTYLKRRPEDYVKSNSINCFEIFTHRTKRTVTLFLKGFVDSPGKSPLWIEDQIQKVNHLADIQHYRWTLEEFEVVEVT